MNQKLSNIRNLIRRSDYYLAYEMCQEGPPSKLDHNSWIIWYINLWTCVFLNSLLFASSSHKFNKHRSAVIWTMIPHCLIFLCGVFCLKGMLVLSKEVRDLFMIWSYLSSRPYLSGQMLRVLFLLFLWLILLDCCNFHAL